MAKTMFPVAFDAEFRGREAATEFNDRETGELVKLGQVLKLERETMDGDAIALPIRLRDNIHVTFDADKLKRGDKVRVEGEVVINDARPGYFKPFKLSAVAA
jgi:hypothetical protein